MNADARRVEYHQLHDLGRRGWWRPVVGVPLLAVLFVAIGPLVVQALFLLAYAVSGADIGHTAKRLVDTDHVTPLSLAALNVTLAAAIPSAMLVTRMCHGLRPAWLGSVVPRIRWGWLFACLGLAVIALIATLIVAAVLPDHGGNDTSGGLNDWTSTTRDFVLVIVLLTPLQAAGEEYAFRGYLTQACGRILPGRWSRLLAVVIPAVLFAAAHGPQDLPTFFDRFAFGLVAGVLVIATGGLEAGIAMHVLNNFLAYGLALAYTDMSSALNPTGGTWWQIPTTLTQSLVYLGLAVGAARLFKVRTSAARPTRPASPATELEGVWPRV